MKRQWSVLGRTVIFLSLAVIISLSGCEAQKGKKVSAPIDSAWQMINDGQFAAAVKFLETPNKDISKDDATRLLNTAKQFTAVEAAGQKGDLKSAKKLLKKLRSNHACSYAYEAMSYKCALNEKSGKWPTGTYLSVHIETQPAEAVIIVNNQKLGKSAASFIVKQGDSFSLETPLAGYCNPIAIVRAEKSQMKIDLTPFSLDVPAKNAYYPFAQKLVDDLDIDNAVAFIGKYTMQVHGRYGPGMLRSVKEFQQAFQLYHEKKYDEAQKKVQGIIGMNCCAYGQVYKVFGEKFIKAIELARQSEK